GEDGARVGVHVPDEYGEVVGLEDGVGVEEEDVGRAGGAQGEVAAAAEADVAVALDDGGPGEVAADEIGGAVGAAVVDDGADGEGSADAAFDAGEGIADDIAGVVGHDDGGDGGRGARHEDARPKKRRGKSG